MSTNDKLQLIGAIRRGEREEIRVCLTEYQGKRKLDIRSWFRPDGKEEMVATKRGVSIPCECWDQIFSLVGRVKDTMIVGGDDAAQSTSSEPESNINGAER